MPYQYLFGPVPSRRLGISLGVDLVPPKVCSLDCVYCECGPTTRLTVERAEYVPADKVLSELDAWLAANPPPDFVTFSGAGEPTLHDGLGRIVRHLKARSPVPLALITNSTLLGRPEVREEILPCDVVLPSLDAVSDEALARLNRPHSSLRIDAIITGLAAFRQQFSGQIWLEIFLVEGINTGDREIGLLQEAIDRIRPDRVQLNSLDRPGAESWVRPPPLPLMESLAARLRHPRVEIIARYRCREDIRSYAAEREDAIVTILTRRPCTAEDLASVLGMELVEINRYLDVLAAEDRVRLGIAGRGIFYRAVLPAL